MFIIVVYLITCHKYLVSLLMLYLSLGFFFLRKISPVCIECYFVTQGRVLCGEKYWGVLWIPERD